MRLGLVWSSLEPPHLRATRDSVHRLLYSRNITLRAENRLLAFLTGRIYIEKEKIQCNSRPNQNL